MQHTGRTVVGYVRVSTQKQGVSQLGLEAQLASIDAFVKANSCQLLAVHTEIESGRKSERPELAKAISRSNRSGSLLVVAKLDRLSRDVAFLSTLMKGGVGGSGVDFVCCDNPFANRLTLQIMAVIGENEAIAISTRTKDALKAYKARGGLLGGSRVECRNLTDDGRKRGQKRSGELAKASADNAYTDIAPQMLEWRQSGDTLDCIAQKLNAAGHLTRRHKQWNRQLVKNVIDRFMPSPA